MKQEQLDENSRSALVQYRMQRAKETLADADALSERGSWLAAVNRLYYACYYAAVALLVHNHISAHTHDGVKQQLGLHFVKTGLLSRELGRFYSQLFNDRMSGDYDDFITCDKETVMDSRPQAEEFINAVEELIILN